MPNSTITHWSPAPHLGSSHCDTSTQCAQLSVLVCGMCFNCKRVGKSTFSDVCAISHSSTLSCTLSSHPHPTPVHFTQLLPPPSLPPCLCCIAWASSFFSSPPLISTDQTDLNNLLIKQINRLLPHSSQDNDLSPPQQGCVCSGGVCWTTLVQKTPLRSPLSFFLFVPYLSLPAI